MSQSSALTALLGELALEVGSSTSPEQSWNSVVTSISAKGNIEPALIPSGNIDRDTTEIGKQLHTTLSKAPLPPELTFLYFGLFEQDDSTGFYVSGGRKAPENPNHLSEEMLTYSPDGHLNSQILDELIRLSKLRPESHSWFGYALTWGAAATLARFGSRNLGLKLDLLVGFDSGDVERVAP